MLLMIIVWLRSEVPQDLRSYMLRSTSCTRLEAMSARSDVIASSLSMCFIHKSVTISRFACRHVHNGLVGVFQRPLLDPRLDVFLGSELKHFLRTD